MTEDQLRHLSRAIDLGIESVSRGGGPFGAVVVTADGRTFEGTNRVTLDNDPSAHAEVVAIREACSELGSFELRGATVYASCEPCPMCLAASIWARVDAVFFAADRHAAAAAGFSDAQIYQHLAGESAMVTVERLAHPAAGAPFEAWERFEQRIRY